MPSKLGYGPLVLDVAKTAIESAQILAGVEILQKLIRGEDSKSPSSPKAKGSWGALEGATPRIFYNFQHFRLPVQRLRRIRNLMQTQSFQLE